MAIKFFKDWLVQKSNTYLIDGVPKVLTRDFGTVYQEGDKDKADYFNEIQKNCVYSVDATRVIEGVVEIYDITLTGSDVFPLFNTQFLVNFNETNTKVDPVLRWNGKTYAIRKNYRFDSRQFEIGEIRKRNLVVLDQINSIALVNEFINEEYTEEITCLTATGSYIIPAGLPVGTKKLYRKVNATQGTVTISTSGSEKITKALLSSVSLNSDGDFWLLEKISATRWDLVDGFERAGTPDNLFIRYANGIQKAFLSPDLDIKTISETSVVQGITYYKYVYPWTMLRNFKTPNRVVVKGHIRQNLSIYAASFYTSSGATWIDINVVSSVSFASFAISGIKVEAEGEWY